MNVERFVGGALFASYLLTSAPVLAAPQSEASAEVLFKEAKRLTSQGKFAEACPKYEESQKLSPAAGTLVNLADCYEKLGKTASAWATFKEAQRAASMRKRQDWVDLSTERAAALELKLSKLTVSVDDSARVAGLEVKRDGAPLGAGEWGTAVPVDPGSHVVEASAPGKKPFTTRVEITGDKQQLRVKIAALEDAPSAPVAPIASTDHTTSPPEEPRADGASGRRTLGFIVGGVGIVGVGVGVVTGLMAVSKKSEAKDICPTYPDHCLDRSAQAPNDSAQSLATVSTISFIAGGALVAAGAFLVLTSPDKATAMRVSPRIGTADAGLQLAGTF
jgi:hypothetical protein